MCSFSEIVTVWAGHVIRSLSMLLLFTDLYVMIEAFRMKRGIPFRALTCVQTGVGLFFFSILLDGTFHETYLPIERTYPAVVNALFNAPWIVSALILSALIAVCIGGLISNQYFKKTHIFQDAVKQTVDLLPEGVCFVDGDGTAVFFNVKMDEWCSALTGEPLNSAASLRKYVTEHGEQRGDSRIVLTRDGTALMFGSKEVKVGARIYTQITAIDVSEQYRITEELRENRADLINIRKRMKEFSERSAELAMSEELLKARVTVHDEIGHVLLRIKYYLDKPEMTDERKLVELIRTMNDLLMSDAEMPESGSGEDGGTVEASVRAASAIGVDVVLRGELPEDGLFRAILARAIRESAVNAVKHAGGRVLTVDLSASPGGSSAALTNDGRTPSGKVRESGGLASLRVMVENARGSMTVESEPRFRLMIKVKGNG